MHSLYTEIHACPLMLVWIPDSLQSWQAPDGCAASSWAPRHDSITTLSTGISLRVPSSLSSFYMERCICVRWWGKSQVTYTNRLLLHVLAVQWLNVKKKDRKDKSVAQFSWKRRPLPTDQLLNSLSWQLVLVFLKEGVDGLVWKCSIFETLLLVQYSSEYISYSVRTMLCHLPVCKEGSSVLTICECTTVIERNPRWHHTCHFRWDRTCQIRKFFLQFVKCCERWGVCHTWSATCTKTAWSNCRKCYKSVKTDWVQRLIKETAQMYRSKEAGSLKLWADQQLLKTIEPYPSKVLTMFWLQSLELVFDKHMRLSTSQVTC